MDAASDRDGIQVVESGIQGIAPQRCQLDSKRGAMYPSAERFFALAFVRERRRAHNREEHRGTPRAFRHADRTSLAFDRRTGKQRSVLPNRTCKKHRRDVAAQLREAVKFSKCPLHAAGAVRARHLRGIFR